MNFCEFSSPKLYLESKITLEERVIAIDALIDVMILSLADTVTKADIATYSLDDGQVKIATGYRSVKDVQNGIFALEQMKQMYLNRLNGRVFAIRDENAYRR